MNLAASAVCLSDLTSYYLSSINGSEYMYHISGIHLSDQSRWISTKSSDQSSSLEHSLLLLGDDFHLTGSNRSSTLPDFTKLLLESQITARMYISICEKKAKNTDKLVELLITIPHKSL